MVNHSATMTRIIPLPVTICPAPAGPCIYPTCDCAVSYLPADMELAVKNAVERIDELIELVSRGSYLDPQETVDMLHEIRTQVKLELADARRRVKR